MAVKEEHSSVKDDRNSFLKPAFTKKMSCKLCLPKTALIVHRGPDIFFQVENESGD
jgi:hypothetical protein